MARKLTQVDPSRVEANLARARERIADACRAAGRDEGDVEIVVATKYVPLELMGALVEAGIGLVGENTAQDLVAKHARWGTQLTFDFIGHLQSRKARQVLPLVRLIHSVESESLVARIARHSERPVDLLLEVNVSGEPTKYGVEPADVDVFVEKASTYDQIVFAGLMTMPPFSDDPEASRPLFAALNELAGRLDQAWGTRHRFGALSMGTSQDYEVAVQEGATIVRIGGSLLR